MTVSRLTTPPVPSGLVMTMSPSASISGDRVSDLGKAGHVLVARVGKISAGDLRAAFEQMAGERAGGEPVPVVRRPPEHVQQRTERESGIGDPPGHNDVGALVERLRDRLRAEIEIGGDDVACLRQNLAAGFTRSPARCGNSRPLRSSPSTIAIRGEARPCSRAIAGCAPPQPADWPRQNCRRS